jgi:Ca2+-binding EF-hand superfamily protein
MTEAQLGALMSTLDRDGDRRIDANEFVAAFKRTSASSWLADKVSSDVRSQIRAQRARLEDIFIEFDINGDGLLSRAELQQGLETLGVHLTKGDMRKLMAVVDEDGDGLVDYHEFLSGVGRSSRDRSRGGSPSRARPGGSVRKSGASLRERRQGLHRSGHLDQTWTGRSAQFNRGSRADGLPSPERSMLLEDRRSPSPHRSPRRSISPIPRRSTRRRSSSGESFTIRSPLRDRHERTPPSPPQVRSNRT